MSNNDNWAVGLVHEICPTCGEKHNQSILIPKKLTKATKKKIEDVNHKAIGISHGVCNKCKETYIDKGYICLIEIDPEKSDTRRRETIFYTGRTAWIRKNVLEQLINEVSKFIIEDSYVYLDIGTFTQITNIPTE